MSIDKIVNVTVDRQTRAPSQQGFGTPLIVAYHEQWLDRVREYAEVDELVDDGFATTSAVYKLFSAAKAQDPSPLTIKVGRRENAFTQIVHLLPRSTAVGFEHSIAIDGTACTYEVETGDAVADIVAGLVTAINAASLGVTATNGTTHVVCASNDDGVVHTYEAKRGLDLLDATLDPGLADDLNAINAEDGDWYGILLDSNSSAQITTLATWTESKLALGLVQSADWNVKDAGESGDVATAMVSSAYARTSGLYCSTIGVPAAAAWMGKELPRNPGQSTWAFKTLATVPVDKLTDGEKNAINGKKWSHYTRVGGVNITYESKTPAGEFIDIVIGIDFSTARIKEAVFGLLVNNPKVPQTDTGIEMIRGAVLSVLKQCSSSDYPIFDPESIEVTVPKIGDVPVADRANRVLPSVRYSARLQGAFHGVQVRGSVFV
jgi:hypothetical protein